MPNVLVPTPRGQMPSWLAVPSNSGPVPGVVVLHDVFGMSQDHRNQADWLAEAGFLALSIDLYYRGGMLRCLRAVMRDITARSGPAFDDVEAARTWLLAQPNCNGKAGVIGFCMGGGFALLLASATASPLPASTMAASSLPILRPSSKPPAPSSAATAARANWKRRRRAARASLATRPCPHDVKEYPDAGHAFMNNHGRLLFQVLRLPAWASTNPPPWTPAAASSPSSTRILTARADSGLTPIIRNNAAC